jgi:hypothetical protein
MTLRAFRLPLLALIAVAVVLAVQFAAGGANYKPSPVSVVCEEPGLPPQTDDTGELIETIVLNTAQRAACDLGISRERLLLAIPSAAERDALAQERGISTGALTAAIAGAAKEELSRDAAAGRTPSGLDLLSALPSLLGG